MENSNKIPLSDLKEGLKVRLEKHLPVPYSFIGKVTKKEDGLYIWHSDSGYLMNEKFHAFWDKIARV
jgi:hypothetical protein